jgi:hypothetical protein
MELSNSWEPNSLSASQEILRLLQKIHCRVQINPPLDPILSQINPIDILMREADHWSPSSDEDKNNGAIPQLPHTSSRRDA